MAQHTITIPITRSTFVDYYNPNQNYGGSDYIRCGGWNRNDGNEKYVAFMDWDHGFDPPDGKKIIKTSLWVYNRVYVSKYDEDSRANGLGVAELSIAWQENTLTYNNAEKWMSYSTCYEDSAAANTYIELDVNNTFVRYNEKGFALQRNGFAIDYFEFNSTRAASNKPYIEVVYEDVPPSPPAPIDPIGAYKDNLSIIRFEWQYKSSVGGAQKAFDLQWSTDQLIWQTVSQTTPNNYYDMPSDTLPSGNIYWRVQTYNEYDESSGYSDISAFYSIGAPGVPTIQSITTNTSRPLISWASDSQQVFQLQVLQNDVAVYDTGQIASMSDKSHKVKRFLADGDYVVRVRTKNEYDIWSDWGEAPFAIQTTKPDSLRLQVFGMRYGTRLMFESAANYVLVYRKTEDEAEYTCIGKIESGQRQYDDCTAASGKRYSYFLRNVSQNETFADSNIVSQPIKLQHAQIALATEPENTFLLKYNLSAPPDRKESRNHQRQQMYFEGRKYPVEEYSGFGTHDLSCTFFLSEKEIDTFYTLFDNGGIVIYRDNRGRKLYGSMNNITTSDTYRGRTIGFTLSEVDYTEGIEV